MAAPEQHEAATRPKMEKHQDPDPIEYENSVYQKGLQYQRPPFTFKPLEWEALAAERMSAESRGYVTGNAGTGETARKNREAFGRWSIVPRRLAPRPAGDGKGFPDLSVTGLRTCAGRPGGEQQGDRRLPFPIACAPVGVQRIFNPDGEEAAAAAAAKARVPYIMSTASSTSIEDVAKANGDGERWFQLYWPPNERQDITKSILDRAQKAGFSALFVTLDTYILGWRPSDMDNG